MKKSNDIKEEKINQKNDFSKPLKNTLIVIVISILFLGNCLGIGIFLINKKTINNLNNVIEEALKPLKMEKHVQLNNKKIVFSVDDTINIFKDLTKNKNTYKSIFDNETLKRFQDLHNEYGLIVTFYVFYDFNNFKLNETTDKFKKEFASNSDWMKFGFHAYESDSNYANSTQEKISMDYNQVLDELIRIVGNESIDTNIRLHYYAGNQKSIEALKNSKYGITGLYTADDERASYYLSDSENELIQSTDYILKDGIYFVHTDYRLENIDNFKSTLANLDINQEIITFFTHEWLLNDKEIWLKIKNFCDYASLNNLEFTFLNVLE